MYVDQLNNDDSNSSKNPQYCIMTIMYAPNEFPNKTDVANYI